MHRTSYMAPYHFTCPCHPWLPYHEPYHPLALGLFLSCFAAFHPTTLLPWSFINLLFICLFHLTFSCLESSIDIFSLLALALFSFHESNALVPYYCALRKSNKFPNHNINNICKSILCLEFLFEI